MNTSEYFIWEYAPTLVKIGPIELPFEVTLIGLIASVLLYFYIYNTFLDPNTGKNTKGRRAKKQDGDEGSPVPLWKSLAWLAGLVLAGQIVFFIVPVLRFETIGPIEIRWYGLLFAMAFLFGYYIERGIFIRASRTEEEIESLLSYMLIATVIGARLGHCLFYDPVYYLSNPLKILAIWEGGLASHGAAIGILYSFYLYTKNKPKMSYLWLADRVVIVVALGGAFIRTGNFFNHEIVGHVTDVPWAVIFTRLGLDPRHPTMLYEAVLCLFVFAVVWWIFKRYRERPPEGSIFGTFLILLFGGRFFLEFTKVAQADFAGTWTLKMGQILSIPLIALGAWLLFSYVNWKREAEMSVGSD